MSVSRHLIRSLLSPSVTPLRTAAAVPSTRRFAAVAGSGNDGSPELAKTLLDTSKTATGRTRHTGRAWRVDELRLKSFEDLHKLWYILLRERNMLLTEKEINKHIGKMPKPARLRKVKLSMARLKTVVDERSRVYKALNEYRLQYLEPQAKEEAATSEEAVAAES